VIIQTINLTKRYGKLVALSGLHLNIQESECFGYIGPNGAGKTTTIRILTTLLPVVEGEARILGLEVSQSPMQARRLVGYVPQQLSADGQLTGRENVAMFARLFDVPRRERAERVAEVLHVMNLDDAADRVASTFSGGMVRRLELAQALVNRPRVLILDEPTIGLDPVGRDTVWDRLRLLQEEGITVLITTHYMEEAEELCDRVSLMHRGRIRAVGTPTELEARLAPEATLEDVFRFYAGDSLEEGGELRDVRSTRRVARRLG
jgi:ABC-2 type transport system ATP-binding protein